VECDRFSRVSPAARIVSFVSPVADTTFITGNG